MTDKKDLPTLDAPSIVPGFDLRVVREMAQDAVRWAQIDITLEDDYGPGLPPSIPMVYDDQRQCYVSVREELERWRMFPRNKAGTAKVLTLDSFVDLTNRHKTANSAIFANTDWRKPAFTTIVDYHEAKSAGSADNLRHRIAYEFPLDDAFKAWLDAGKQMMTQTDFAAFLEDRIADLSSPTEAEVIDLERDFGTKIATPSRVLELSRGLQVNVAATVKATTVLQSGEGEIRFTEAHVDATGAPLKVPGLFILSIPIFFMGEPERIPVRLRYRVVEGKIKWAVSMFRADQIVTARVRGDLQRAGDDTGLPCFEGGWEGAAP